jgi:hypothetical protein
MYNLQKEMKKMDDLVLNDNTYHEEHTILHIFSFNTLEDLKWDKL